MFSKHNIWAEYLKVLPEMEQRLPVAPSLAAPLKGAYLSLVCFVFMRLESIIPIWRKEVAKLLLCRRGHSYALSLPLPFIGPFSIFSTTQAEQRHTAEQLSSYEDAARRYTATLTLFISLFLFSPNVIVSSVCSRC